ALVPLEAEVLERESRGEGVGLTESERKPIDAKARELGLWGLDAPAEFGGSDLPVEAMVGVHEELAKTVTPYTFPPDSPNLRMLMAVTGKTKGARGGISAFLIDKATAGFNVLRRIPMIGGHVTYEIVLEDCRVPAGKLLGKEGQGFAPMQVRLSTRRVQMACW